jgi:hypothetical protein
MPLDGFVALVEQWAGRRTMVVPVGEGVMNIVIRKAALGLGLVLIAGAACSCASPAGEAVAASIRQSNAPAIGKVVFRAQNMLDPEEIDVWLAPGVSEADAERLWCEVIVPAGGSQEGDHVVVVWNDTGTAMMATNPTCPPAHA